MTTLKIATSAAHDVHVPTLRQAPARLLTFLQAVSSDRTIATLLSPLGWSDERVTEAWALLNELRDSGRRRAGATHEQEQEAPVAIAAIAACEAFQSTGLVCARAMLSMTHPEQASFLFDDLSPGAGTAAVFNVGSFLERCDALLAGADRKATRKADHEALAMMSLSGTTKEKLKELKAQVRRAQSQSAAVIGPDEAESANAAEAQRLEALRKIYVWITAWSEMARTVVKRRDYQIRLGLAKPRRNKKAPPPAEPPVAAPPLGASTRAAGSTPSLSAADEHGPESRAA